MAGELTIKQAIEKVLKEAVPAQMHRQAIARKVTKLRGDIRSRSVRVELSRRLRKEGKACPWQRVGRGLYTWRGETQNEVSLILEEDMDKPDDWYENMGTPWEPMIVYQPEREADGILDEGCFLEHGELVKILERVRVKKNLILQGPPGTGKTWLAKRLAEALLSWTVESDKHMRAVQFHPTLSYEDFVRGWRPAGDGKLRLTDGPFLEMVNAAKKDPAGKYVLIIEEINRGNPAQIFGEMLTLLEADKRSPDYALELSYRREEGERVFIPENLYMIGTMNIADRSLALVDLALRRRFAFIDLEPVFGGPWRDWVHKQCGIDLDILTDIEKRIQELNDQISVDSSLGPQFRIGHSYVTPPSGTRISDAHEWFRQVVETEIGPQLNEIWSDDLAKAQQARQDLLKGF